MCTTAAVPCPKTCRLANALYPGMSVPQTVNDYEKARRHLRQEMVSGLFVVIADLLL